MNDNIRSFFATSICPLQYRDKNEVRKTLPVNTRLIVSEIHVGAQVKYVAVSLDPNHSDFELRVTPKVYREIQE